MTIADLVLRYLQALVWPLAVLIIAVMFRGSIRAAVGRLTEVTGPGVSAKFETEAESLAAHAKEIADRQTAPSYRPGPYGPGSSYGPGHESPHNGEVPSDASRLTFPPPPPPSPDVPPAPPAPVTPGTPSGSAPADDEDEDGLTEPTRDLRPPSPPAPPPPSERRDPLEPAPSRPSPDELRQRVRATFAAARSTAESDPLAAIRSAWLDVRRTVAVLTSCTVEELTDASPPRTPSGAPIRSAIADTAPEMRDLLRWMDRMREDAVASPQAVTTGAARAYITAAEDAVFALYRATGRTP